MGYAKGDFSSQARVFAHDATNVVIGDDLDNVCIYVGTGGDITVTMQSGRTGIIFKNVPSGAFLPVLVKKVEAVANGAGDLLALY
tara:strand:- start:3517 stop:3771 length:255 start_codon:yes stop_codon:yes gene_type:complete